MASLHSGGDPGAQLRLLEQVVGELLAPGPQLGRRLELVDEAQDAIVELAAQAVLAVVGHVVEHRAGTVEQPLEDPVLDGPGQPPRRLGAEAVWSSSRCSSR